MKQSVIICRKTTMRTPGTPLSKTDRTPGGSSRSREEKIVVTVRLRPLNKKEQLAKDQVAWECVDDHTIVSKPQAQERSHHQSSFTFGNIKSPYLCLFVLFPWESECTLFLFQIKCLDQRVSQKMCMKMVLRMLHCLL